MTPEDRELLEETHKLANENNSMLRKMRRAGRWSTIFRVIYWFIVIGGVLGAYYALQPYLMDMAHIIDQSKTILNGNLPR